MSGGNRGFRRTTNTPGGYKNEPHGRVHMYDKVYVGFVKDNRDAIKMGRLKVWIPELSPGDPSDSGRWYTVNYCTPFGGATRSTLIKKGSKDPADTQQSYGFWAVPPDLDNEVIVLFINGDPNRGVWIGSLYQQFMNHMIPGLASDKAYDENFSGDIKAPPNGINPPVKEYNKRSTDAVQGNNTPPRPVFEPLHRGLFNEGLYVDGVRGPSSASARRSDSYDPHSSDPTPDTVAAENTSGAPIQPTIDEKTGKPISPTENNGDTPANTPAIDPADPSQRKTAPSANPSQPSTTPDATAAALKKLQDQRTAAAKKLTDDQKTLAGAQQDLATAQKNQDSDSINRLQPIVNQFTSTVADDKKALDALDAKINAAKNAKPRTPAANAPGKDSASAAGTSNPASSTTEQDDPPALVYGLISPKGNHLYIDDAGDGMVRIRTRNGAQIMINDTVGYIYMITRNGNSWMELSDEGIDMYSSQSISMRAHGDINMHSDGNIHQYAAGTMNHVAQGGGTGNFTGGYNVQTDQLNLTSSGSVNIYSPKRVSISGPSVGIAATGDIGITAGGQIGLTSAGALSLQGAPLKLNKGPGPQARVEPISQSSLASPGGSGGSGGGSGGGGSSGGGSGHATDTSTAAPVLPSPGSAGAGKLKQAMSYFIGQGWTKEQAAGIVANLQYESGLNEKQPGDHGAAYGIAQWHSDRQANFQRLFGHSIRQGTFEEQLAFVNHELTTGTEKGAGSHIKQTSSAADATSAMQRYYERPADPAQSINQRTAIANSLVQGQYSADKGVTGAAPSSATQDGMNTSTPGLDHSPHPADVPNSGEHIAGPISAATPSPNGLNDRALDVDNQYPECATYTIVSRLVTHEPFHLHPTAPTDPITGAIPSSMPTAPQGPGNEQPINDQVKPPETGATWVYPTNGTVANRRFGVQMDPAFHKIAMHDGVDIHASSGTPVVACADGKVRYAPNPGGYGNRIFVDHAGGISTFYAHLSAYVAANGAQVKAGDVIGRVGSTGASTGPHLHLGMHVNGQKCDPGTIFPKFAHSQPGNPPIQAGETAKKG